MEEETNNHEKFTEREAQALNELLASLQIKPATVNEEVAVADIRLVHSIKRKIEANTEVAATPLAKEEECP